MLDSGVRRGADIVLARCLGADMCFVGRATMYGAAAAALPGVRKAISILREELDLTLGALGYPALSMLGPHVLFDGGEMKFEARSNGNSPSAGRT